VLFLVQFEDLERLVVFFGFGRNTRENDALVDAVFLVILDVLSNVVVLVSLPVVQILGSNAEVVAGARSYSSPGARSSSSQ
jgi:hypothetical protein